MSKVKSRNPFERVRSSRVRAIKIGAQAFIAVIYVRDMTWVELVKYANQTQWDRLQKGKGEVLKE